ncbi:ERAP1-like C-terminal domain-containing protein [Paraglaciecola aquimarina]|uniref:ERAP1-like C-terminal domain-containing protein n=1 Tax=Paraglaciecola algarum TaxID=3050085 RepID=A0ABS9D823_9ALTE|nr:ERAP1-like C-terminal domain-containing protein [Paraglaciecola sp. G1-23]MCF2948173.1 ERAP1-like C-terminal domain-containing protein [Paraglaciecola sp. G1-23]
MMSILNVLVDDTDPLVGNAVVGTLNSLVYLVDESNEHLFAEYVSLKLSPWFKRLGVDEQADDSVTVSRLRAAVYGLLAKYSNTPEIQKISLSLANQYLADQQSIPRNMAIQALSNLAKFSTDDWFTKMQALYMSNSDASVRGTLRSAMKFKTPADVAKTLNFALTENVGPANTITMVRNAIASQDDLTMFYTWLDDNFNALSKKLPAYHLASMPEYLSQSCHTDNIKLATAFYTDKKADFEGMERSFEVAMNAANQCVSLKSTNQASFTQYIQSAIK